LLALLVCLALVCPASATVLTFDDITTDPVTMLPIPDNYGGLNWDNIYVMDAVNYYQPSGYRNALVSGSYVAWGFGEAGDEHDPESFASVITVTNPDTFDFIGVYLTAAWNDDLNISVEASLEGALLYSQTVVVNPFGPTWFGFDFVNINHLRFISFGGTPVPEFDSHDGGHFVLDNFTFTPEPSTILLLGLGGLALLRKRRA
jgi:hypothetical protein